jgi:hypothetical protein
MDFCRVYGFIKGFSLIKDKMGFKIFREFFQNFSIDFWEFLGISLMFISEIGVKISWVTAQRNGWRTNLLVNSVINLKISAD